jgi:ubiquinone biosynthesis protein COQ9
MVVLELLETFIYLSIFFISKTHSVFDLHFCLFGAKGIESSLRMLATTIATVSKNGVCRMIAPASRRRIRHTIHHMSRWSSSSSFKEEQGSDNKNDMQDVRTKLLQSALHQVHEHGWTQDAIAAAVAFDRTVSIALAGMIQPHDLIAFSMDHWNQQLELDLSMRQEIWKKLDSSVSSRIEESIKARLGYLLPYIISQRWHEGMAMGVRDPQAALHTKEQLQQLIQIVASAVVVDKNNTPLSDWQQFTLGGVYVATELFLLTDQSPDWQDTWEFLHERVGEWEQVTSQMDAGILMNPSAMLQHSSHVAYTASAVASSLAGGVVSLIQPNVMLLAKAGAAASSSVPEQMWNALIQTTGTPKAASNNSSSGMGGMEGTDPSHYDSKPVTK